MKVKLIIHQPQNKQKQTKMKITNALPMITST